MRHRPALFAFLLVLLVPVAALAQAIEPAPSTTINVTSLVLLGCAGLSALIRTVLPSESWTHTKIGAGVLSLLGLFVGALASLVQAHGFSLGMLGMAAMGAASSFIGALNPSNVGNPVATKAATSAVTAMLLGILIGSVGLAGCATIPTPGGGTISPAQYTSNYETCLKNEGVTQAMPEVAKIWNILDQAGPNASSVQIENDVETAALTLSGDAAIICIDCTIIAWDASNPVPPDVAPTPAQAAVRLYKAKYRAHPVIAHARATAMRDRKAAEKQQQGGAQ